MFRLIPLIALHFVQDTYALVERQQNVENLFPASAYGNCCAIIANFVGLNVWYTGHVEVTVATVYTTLSSYSDTIITAAATVTNANLTLPGGSSFYSTGMFFDATNYNSFSIAGVPTDLIASQGPGGYGGTAISIETAVTAAGVVVPSPTPAMLLPEFWVLYGIDSGSSCSLDSSAGINVLTLARGPSTDAAGFVYASLTFPVDAAHPTDSYQIVYLPPNGQNPASQYQSINSDDFQSLPMPQNVVDQLAAIPEIVSQVPNIASCYPDILFGAPTAKIVVSTLTASTTITEFYNGYFSAPIISTYATDTPTSAADSSPTLATSAEGSASTGTQGNGEESTAAAASSGDTASQMTASTATAGSSPSSGSGTPSITSADATGISIGSPSSTRSSAVQSPTSSAYAIRSVSTTNGIFTAIAGLLWPLIKNLL